MAFDDPFGDNPVTIASMAEKLIKAADRIIDMQIAIALGGDMPEGFEKGNKDYQQKILDYITPMIKEYQQTKNITAKSANQVVGMLKKGEVTPTEALNLLRVVKEKIKLEEDELAFRIKKQLIKAVDTEEKCQDESTAEPKALPEKESSQDGSSKTSD
jgi:deoxyribodipyrimidine photolyase